jgi:membrane protein YqaA with SNARE-associated domain
MPQGRGGSFDHGLLLAFAPRVRSFTHWLVGAFASPVGLFLLAALDSSVFISLPFGLDAVLIIMAARRPNAWIVPLLAVAGSLTGAGVTFWMGVKLGEKGLERYVPAKRLQYVRQRVEKSGAVALAALSLIPPPFPFTPFLLAAGALEVQTSTFFITLAVCRFARFGTEALLAVRYGRRFLRWLESPLFQNVVAAFIVLACVLTALSIIRIVRSSRDSSRRVAA